MFESYSDEPLYNVKAVASQSGVSPSTLRAWERRYGIPVPPRNTNGYRLYSARDIAIVRWLKTRVDGGMSISQAVNLYHSEAQAQVRPVPGVGAAMSAEIASGSHGFQRLQADLMERTLTYDENGAENTLGEAFSLFAVEDVCQKLLQPVLSSIGEGWHRGDIPISAEHFITNIIRRKLLALIGTSPLPTRQERVVVGCAPEEFHEIGVLMLALFLRRRGMDVIYLGQNVAASRLEEMLAVVKSAVLILSATTLQTAARLLDIAELMETQQLHSVVLAVGGLVFRQSPLVRQHIPATYLGDDVHTGVTHVLELLEGRHPTRTQVTHVSDAVRAVAQSYSMRQSEIVQHATHQMLSESTSRTSAPSEQLLEANRQFAVTLGAALRFGEPDLMCGVAALTWGELSDNARDRRSGDSGEWDRYLHHFLNAVLSVMLTEETETIAAYIDAAARPVGA